MPVYTYRRADGTTFDYRQKFSDEPLSTDPTTGQSVTRVVQAAGIIFKGSGFYVNDTKGANKSAALPADKGEKSEKSDSDSSSTSETKETKPAESSAPAKSETSSTSTASSAAD